MAIEAVQERGTTGKTEASEAAEEMEAAHVAAVTEVETSGQVVQERCIKQHVQTVVRKQKYLLYPLKADLFTAGNASRITDLLKDIRRKGLIIKREKNQ